MTLRWFRFHLSTAVLLMVAAGGLIWANLESSAEKAKLIGSEIGYGFPVNALDAVPQFLPLRDTWGLADQREIERFMRSYEKESDGQSYFNEEKGWFFYPPLSKFKRRPFGFVIDGLFALLVLFFVAFLSEYFIRRRKNPERKTS